MPGNNKIAITFAVSTIILVLAAIVIYIIMQSKAQADKTAASQNAIIAANTAATANAGVSINPNNPPGGTAVPLTTGNPIQDGAFSLAEQFLPFLFGGKNNNASSNTTPVAPAAPVDYTAPAPDGSTTLGSLAGFGVNMSPAPAPPTGGSIYVYAPQN